jgi:xylulokinase
MSLMGIDIGTSGCKGVVFDHQGSVLASAYREYPLVQPREDWVELEPEVIWNSVLGVLKEAGSQILADPVAAIGVSSQGETVAAVDTQAKGLCNFIVTFDNRTVEQARSWERTLSRGAIFRLTGMPLHPMYSINKILWLREHRPDAFRRAHKFTLVQDFVIARLCGEFGIDYTLASRSMAFDVTKKVWAAQILDAAGVEETRLSPPYPSGTVIGVLRPELASEIGFKGKVSIVTGGHDQPCGALGAGIVESGTAMNATGTVDAVCPVFENAPFTDAMLADNYAVYPSTMPRLYCTIGFNLTGGLLLKWYRDTLCTAEQEAASRAGRNVYDMILSGMASSPKDLFVLPHFVGSGTPSLDPFSKGAIVGLRISTTKSDLTRAIVDSINFEMKHNLECLAANGIPIREVHAVGGGAKSNAWLTLKASCFGLPVRRPKVQEAVSLGSAILAGVATGVFADPVEGAREMVSMEDTFEPDANLHAVYQEKYAKFRELYGRLADFNRSLE